MLAKASEGTRCLVACAACTRQYDATGFAAGSRFHCSCGAVIAVPRFRANDAAVVRCSSCGAPRQRGAPACAACGGDFTLHEQDLHTLCPSCMARISDRARFCHHCATPIVSHGEVGERTKLACPACGRRHKLASRKLGQAAVTVLECVRCAGLWLRREAFEIVAERARDRALPPQVFQEVEADPAARQPRPAGERAAYRRCPDCSGLMHRRNFGRHSGVIVDTCRDHGLWFDLQELDAVLRWVRESGEVLSAERTQAETRHAERQRRIKHESLERATKQAAAAERGGAGGDMFGELFGALFDL
jgi:Zn-finger nucleic acid-binding protein